MSRSKKVFTTLLIIAVVIIAGVVIMRNDNLRGFFISGGEAGNASGYQAVFLTNNQVFFGKVSSKSSHYVTLREAYYLQVNQTGAQITAEDITLVKRGNELHGPTDVMKVNREHVLYIEDMKEDSAIVDAIKRFQSGGN